MLVATPLRATLERQWQSDDNDDSVYSSFFDTTENKIIRPDDWKNEKECNKAINNAARINNELLLIFLLQKRICRGRVCCWGRSNGRCLFVVHRRIHLCSRLKIDSHHQQRLAAVYILRQKRICRGRVRCWCHIGGEMNCLLCFDRRMRKNRNCPAGVVRGCNTKQPCFYKDYDYDGFFIVVTLHEK